MQHILKGLFFLQLIYHIVTINTVSVGELLLVQLIVAVYVIKERFWNSVYLLAGQLLIVTAAVYFHMPLGFLYALIAFDFAYKEVYLGVAFTVLVMLSFTSGVSEPLLLLLIGACTYCGYILRHWEKQQLDHYSFLDKERQLRYSLEQARNKLIVSAKETVHLAETKERNRIAREIHDSIGHSIAGVLIQLQVAQKLVGKDDEKARETLELCTGKLAESLKVARETIYNLKPREKLGVEYIKQFVDEYTFCPVDASFEGDFEQIPAEHLEAAAAIIKEALTNTTKYSKATQVTLQVETNEKFTRILFQDNGMGCGTIREGMGISGMRERVKNLGGQLSITSENGFLIVCVLYR